MPTQDTLDTGTVSIEESNNNAPNATGSFQRALKRLSSALGLRQQDTDGNEVERGEHGVHAKGAIDVGDVGEGNHEEQAGAGAAPPSGPLADAPKGQHQSPFSSSAFDRLPQPVPVVEVFFGSWWLISATRTATRLVVIYFSVVLLPYTWVYGVNAWVIVFLAIFVFRWVLLKVGRTSIPLFGTPIPGKRQLFWALYRSVQKIWEHVIARFLLKSDGRYVGLCGVWWFMYMLIAPMAEFRQNYMAAWQQRMELSIRVFVDDEHMSVPIPAEGTDEALLARIRSFYQMMLVGQGFPALVFPKQLQRIDFVEMSKDGLVLGNRLGTLQLGRYKGRLVNIFENPELGAYTVEVAETVRSVAENGALEFQRTYDVGTISVVVAVPPVASLVFGIAWVRVHTHKGVDLQVAVQTAFAVSSYIVTAGALTLALIAFLDQKKAQNDDVIERIARKSFETKATTTSKLDRRSSLP